MKRTFPLIVVLITLSLFGLIWVQLSWFKSLLTVRENQLKDKVNQACYVVSQSLSEGVYSSNPAMQLPRLRGLRLGDFSFKMMRPPSVKEKYSRQEVAAKLRRAFHERELDEVSYDFAVITGEGDFEMYTPNFESAYWDTLNNRHFISLIVPESGSFFEGMFEAEKLIVVVEDFKLSVWESVRWVFMGAVLFMLVIIAAFYITVRALMNQKKLSEIKTDFINNMTHELKTPLATISLAVDALKNERVQQDKIKMDYFSGIIKEENKRMNKHVETILQAALLEKQELKLDLRVCNAHDIIQKALSNYKLQLEEKKGEVVLKLNAEYSNIEVDENHFTNMLSNLIDNAIKYSKEGSIHISIQTSVIQDRLQIRIEDKGIGMSKESVRRVFEKFYRAHTGNVHNVKGFGLGMSYVKSVIDAHKGNIKAESILGKGSVFTLSVPVIKQLL
jgi:two-component system phosphate regulon sensor histidine kinase PhoR